MAKPMTNDPRALIAKLLEDIEMLPHRDMLALDKFKRRGSMVLSNIFDEQHKYVLQFRAIPFKYPYIVWKEGAVDRKWNEGVETTRNLLEAIIEEMDTFPQTEPEPAEPDLPPDLATDGVFVAHGHDEQMLSDIESFLLRIELQPIILRDQPNLGQTVIEKVEANSDVAVSIVLFSPDDMGYPREAGPEDAKLRARQNVVFELGYFIGKLRRGKIILVYRTDDQFDIPSDLGGVVYIPFDDAEKWKGMLVTELDGMGFNLDAGKVARALPR